MEAIAMVIWLGVTPAQLQAVQAAQPAVYRQDLIRVQEQRAIMAERASEPRAQKKPELPNSMR